MPDNDASRDYEAHLEDERRQRAREFFAQSQTTTSQTTTPTTEATASTPAQAPKQGFVPANAVMSGAHSGAMTVLRNVAETPNQVIGGLINGANELLLMPDDAVQLIFPGANSTFPKRDEAGKGPIPTTEEAQTITGGVVRRISEFMAPYGLVSKGLKGLVAGKIARDVLSNAVAGLVTTHPHDERIADLVKDVPVLGPPINEYLGSTEEESAAGAKFKGALEGAGMAVASHGLLTALRVAKYAGKTQILARLRNKTPAQIATDALDARGTINLMRPVTEDDLALLGSRTDSRLVIPRAADRLAKAAQDTAGTDPKALLARADELAAEGVAEGAKQPKSSTFFINWLRIEEPDDIKGLIQGTADADVEAIHGARMGGEVLHDVEVAKLASELDMTPAALIGRRRGVPFSTPEVRRAKDLLQASAVQTKVALEKSVATENPVDAYVANRALAMHTALQREIFAARAETARSLRQWGVNVTTGQDTARMMRDALEATGGAEVSLRQQRRLLAILNDPNAGTKGFNRALDRSVRKRMFDGVYTVWLQGKVANPATHIVNFATNTERAVSSVGERALASKFDPQAIPKGEATHLAIGMLKSVRTGFHLAGEALRTGESQFDALTRLETGMTQSAGAALKATNDLGDFARWIDYAWKVIESPGRALVAGDDFWKGILYGGELHAQAFRDATQRGLTGEDFGRHVAEFIAKHDIEAGGTMLDAALDFARLKTFQAPLGNIGKWVQYGRATVPGVRYVIPFIRVSGNLTKQAIEESPFAPILGQFRQDIMAGGARGATAKAKMAMGTAVALWAVDMTLSGQMTGAGPSNREEYEAKYKQGWRPWSIFAGGQYWQLNRLDPRATQLGWAAQAAEMIANVNDEDADRMGTLVVSSLLENISDKSYLMGMFDMAAAIHDPKFSLDSWARKQGSGFVPFSQLFYAAGKAIDPEQREFRNVGNREATYMDDFFASMREKYGLAGGPLARALGLEEAALRRDMLGDVVTSSSTMGETKPFGPALVRSYDFLSPIPVGDEKPDPIREAIVTNHVAHYPDMESGGVPLTDQEYSRLLEISGEGIKRDIGKMIARPGWARLTSGRGSRQAFMLGTVIRNHQKAARMQLIREFPELRYAIEDRESKKVDVLLGR